MAESSRIYLRSIEEVHSALSLLPRQNGCLKCSQQTLACPSDCASDTSELICQFTIPTCDSCAKAICVKNTPPSSPDSSSNGPSTGAIAGGVVGGLVVVGIVTYLVWRFFIKTKRQPLSQNVYDEDSEQRVDPEKAFENRRVTKRTSTHTVHSIASTVLTRASNIIQIAYIPGVTNRAAPTSPTLLVPPVPPIPMAVSSSNANSPSPYEDQHFFVPGDLRDSTYSGLSGYTDRTSYARTSYAPRSSIAPSIASTIYGKNVVLAAPAQTGRLAKAAVVSVKSVGAGSGTSTPPVPSVDYEKYSRPKSRDSTFSVGSTFLNNASTATATPLRAQVVRVGSGPKKVDLGSKSAEDSSVPSSPDTLARHSPTVRDSNAVTVIEDSPSIDQGPFSDPPNRPMQSTTSLSAVIEEATRRAAEGPDRRSKLRGSAGRETSPFGDEHATRD